MKRHGWWITLVGFAAAACSDGAAPPTSGLESPSVASIELSPSSGSVTVGETLQVTATTKNASGGILTGRPVTWSSGSAGVATVSATGLVTGAAAGTAAIIATSEGKSGTALVRVVPARSAVDRPDNLAGPQIHVMYVVPSDGEDRQLDIDGTLARSLASLHTWFSQRSNGLALRFDTFAGNIDLTFHRLLRSNAELTAFGAFVVNQIEQELRTAGRVRPGKLYAVYYDGGSTHACGGSAWPPRVQGQVAAMYLRGAPNGVQCGAQSFVTSATDFPKYWEFAMLHDILHTLGIVADVAPNHTVAYPGHVPNRNDLMYGGSGSWIIDATTVIDVGGDDYFGPNVPAGTTLLASSPFVTTASHAVSLRVEPSGATAARNLVKAFAILPPHSPFPGAPRAPHGDLTRRR